MKSDFWNYENRTLSGKEFFNLLIANFPTLTDEIIEQDVSSLHSRMEVFSSYTIEQIKSNNILELKRCFDFQESKIDDINLELVNALTVSYCESLMLGEVGVKMCEIVQYMEPKLKDQYLDYEKYYNNLRK